MRSDADLLRDSRFDAGPFRELYERYAGRIYAFLLNRSRDPDAAHDLTAETFAQAWLSRARFRDAAGGSAGPWLHAIARHVLSASVRRGRLEHAARDRLGMTLGDAASTEPDETWLDGLDEALAALPPGQQDAIRLRVVEELSYEQVAGALDTTPEAARVRVHRGLAALRQRLGSGTEAAR